MQVDKKFAKGKVTHTEVKCKGQLIDLDLGSISITGDIKSTGSAIASCGTATGMNLCPKDVGDKEGYKEGDYLKRKPGLVDCNTDEEVDLGEFCGHDAVWVTVYRGWSVKPCGGCDGGEVCYKHFKEKTVYTPTCVSQTSDCSPACDSATEACVDKKCEERIIGDDSMSLKDALKGYDGIFKTADKAVKLAAIFVVAEGDERARGKCSGPPEKMSCDGSGPAATQADCKAYKAKYKVPDTVRMFYDKSGDGWSSDKWFGPKYYNSMMITNSELTIANTFPVSHFHTQLVRVKAHQGVIYPVGEGFHQLILPADDPLQYFQAFLAVLQ